MNLRRTISTFIVCFAAAAPVLMPAYFITSRPLIRHEMMERMEKQNLTAIQVPVEEFYWYEKDREIIVDGKMFDVKSIRLHNGTYYITGLFDEQETELELVLEKKMEDSSLPQQLVQICASVADHDIYLFEPIIPDSPNNTGTEYKLPHFPKYCSSIVIPPPKTWLS
jgi:hypothetical protein